MSFLIYNHTQDFTIALTTQHITLCVPIIESKVRSGASDLSDDIVIVYVIVTRILPVFDARNPQKGSAALEMMFYLARPVGLHA